MENIWEKVKVAATSILLRRILVMVFENVYSSTTFLEESRHMAAAANVLKLCVNNLTPAHLNTLTVSGIWGGGAVAVVKISVDLISHKSRQVNWQIRTKIRLAFASKQFIIDHLLFPHRVDHSLLWKPSVVRHLDGYIDY